MLRGCLFTRCVQIGEEKKFPDMFDSNLALVDKHTGEIAFSIEERSENQFTSRMPILKGMLNPLERNTAE